jgi:copper homeostasis protein
MSNGPQVLEVIACSVADAIEAQQGGAGRLEIISEFVRGGMTPPLELVQQIIAVVSIPVRVMLRESDGYEVRREAEKDRLCEKASQFSSLRIDGVVVGFIRSERIDVEMLQEVLDCAPSLRTTFHHAFEEVDPFLAIRQLKKIKQVDRILTHGGTGSWSARIENLLRYQQQASTEIQIIVGGGLDSDKIARISNTTGIIEFHVGRAARVNGAVDGAVTAEKVKALVAAMKSPAASG